MPLVSLRGGGRRRTINEINMVPFIDVMLVLLIIFMVTAPLITTSQVDVPSIGKAGAKPPKFMELVVGSDERLKLRVDGSEAPLTIGEVGARVKAAQKGDDETAVVISADKGVKYEIVVRAMDALQRAGVKKVGLSVKQAAP